MQREHRFTDTSLEPANTRTLQNLRRMSSKLPEKTTGAVPCDMCPAENPSPARKTCMKCEIAMCVQHLEAHLTTPVLLQTHPLTEPIAMVGVAGSGGGSTKCPQHGKVLEYYCLDDLLNVCVSCAIEGQHRLHDMKTLHTAHQELLQRLDAEQTALANTHGRSLNLERWDKSQRDSLKRSATELIQAMSSLRDLALTSVQSSVATRLAVIKTGKSSMQALKQEKDAFRFLQMFSQVHQDLQKAKAVDLRIGLEPGSTCDKLVQELQKGGHKMIQQAAQLLDSMLTLVNPANQSNSGVDCKSKLTFDPASLGVAMSLSKDHKTVFYHKWENVLSACSLLVQMPETDSNTIKWTFSLPMQFNWTLGLCSKNATAYLRHDISQFQTDMELYSLRWQNYQLVSLTTATAECEEDLPRDITQPEKVEVMWSVSEATLSFFNWSDRYNRREILKLKMQSHGREYTPFLNVDNQTGHALYSQSALPGQFGYTKAKPRNHYGGFSPLIYGSCGQATSVRITEVLCELL